MCTHGPLCNMIKSLKRKIKGFTKYAIECFALVNSNFI